MPTVRKITNPEAPTSDERRMTIDQRAGVSSDAPTNDERRTTNGQQEVPTASTDERAPVAEHDDLPLGWVWATVGELSSHITSGSRGWAQYYAESGAIFVRVGNFNRRGTVLDLDDITFVNAPKGPEADRTRLQEGDVLITITADVGMVGVVDKRVSQWKEGFINQHVCLVRLISTHLSSYIAYVLMDERTQQQIRVRQYGLTKTGLGLEDVKSLIIPLPPLPRAIALEKTCINRYCGFCILTTFSKYSLLQAARKRFDWIDIFDDSCFRRLSAIWRSTAMFSGPCSTRIWALSSFITTSRRQCN